MLIGCLCGANASLSRMMAHNATPQEIGKKNSAPFGNERLGICQLRIDL
jgi:hypothetical protein